MTGESRSVVVRLSMDTAQAMRASKEFGTEVSRAMDQAEKSTGKSRGAMDQLGGSAGKMGLVAAAGLAAVIGATANFDEAMSHVAATGDDAKGSIDELREAAIQAGQDTAFSASEAAGGIENLAKAGVSAQDILGGGLSGALDLAAAGGLEVADAAEVAATALTQFKLEGADVPHVADLLAAAAGKAQGDVTDMSYALKQSGLVASQMGISIEETTGTLAAFASAGLLGSDAGTSFRTMLLRLANPTKKSADLMAELGLQAYDAQGNFVGMASVSGQLQAALQDKTQAERDSALATIFGSDAIRAASVLYDQGSDGIAKWTNNVDDAGYAAETAATRMDNLKGDVEQFLGSLETALIGAGEGSQGALRGMVQGGTDVVNTFNKAPAPIQETATKLLAITAVVGGGAWFGSKVIRGVSDTRQALADLGVTADTTAGRLAKIGGTALGVLAVGTAVGALADNVGRIDVENLDRAMTALNRGEVTDEINDLVGNLEELEAARNAVDFGELATGFGVFGDTTLDKYADNIDQMDQKLAGLVETGEAAQASGMFEQLTALAEEQGVSAEETAKNFDKYALAVRNASGEGGPFAAALDHASAGLFDQILAGKEATVANSDYGVATRVAGQEAAAAKDEINGLVDSMRDQASAAIAAFDAETQWGQSVADARAQVKSGEKGIDKMTEAGRNNRAVLSDLAGAWNNQSNAVKNNEARYKSARKTFVDTAVQLGVNRDKAVAMAKALLEIPKKTVADVDVDTHQAMSEMDKVAQRLREMDGKTATTYVTTVYQHTGKSTQAGGADGDPSTPYRAGGLIIGPGGPTDDRVPILASNGEFMMSAAAVDYYGLDAMFAMNARRLAGGGSVDGKVARSVDNRLDIANVQQQIRDLVRSLNADGKNQLKGLDRLVAKLELRAARQDLRQTRNEPAREQAAKDKEEREAAAERKKAIHAAYAGFDVSAEMDLDQIRDQLHSFREALTDAGGVWTKQLKNMAAELIANAAELERETVLRDQMQESLDASIQAMDELKATMAAYSESVAGNFLNSPFNQSWTDETAVAGGGASAELLARQADLATLEGQLSELRSREEGTVSTAAEASRLLAQIAQMKAAIEDLDTTDTAGGDPTETTVSGLAALKQVLADDTANAEDMLAALSQLAANGLDTTGDLGGLYQQLAASGDLQTAQELAGLSPDELAQIEQMWGDRQQAAAEVAALATQEVYGDQQAALQATIDEQTAAVTLLNATITYLTDEINAMGPRVQAGAGAAADKLKPPLNRIEVAINDLPRKTAEQKKKSRV